MTNATRIANLEAALGRMEALLLHVVEGQAPATTPAPAKSTRKPATRKASAKPKLSKWNVGMFKRYAIVPTVGHVFTSKSGNAFTVAEVHDGYILASRNA